MVTRRPVGRTRRGSVGSADKTISLRRLHGALERQARAIGQRLHDDAGQLLTAAYIALDDAGRGATPRSRKLLADVRGHLAAVEDQLRQVAHELRPRALDDLGLLPALHLLGHGFELRHGVPTTVTAPAAVSLPHTVETAIYRAAQEALTNIGRHARATRVAISLDVSEGQVRCSISDDGVGFDPKALRQTGLGLFGIRERLDLLGGRLRIRSARRAGADLIITIPLHR